MGRKNKCERCKDLSHVYAIAPTSRKWVKIGVATSIRSRLATGQSFHIEELKVVGYKKLSEGEAYRLERRLHNQFSRHKIGYNREIFDSSIIAELKKILNQRDDQFIENMCRGCACKSMAGSQWCRSHYKGGAPRRWTYKRTGLETEMKFDFKD